MADNILVTAGTGTTIGMDEVVDATLGTVKVGFGKIMDGTLDSTNKLIVTAAGAAKVDGSAVTQPISAATLPLPAGAATEATLGTRLAEATFTTRIPVQGQALMAASIPVTIASNQSAIPVTASAGTNLNTSALALDATLTGGTARAIARGGAKGTTVAADITSNPVDANTQALHVDGSKVTQPVSAATLPLPAGAATSALQTQPGVDIGDVTINNAAGASAVNIQDGGNSITVDGPLTDTQLRATAVPVSLTSTTVTGTVAVTDNAGSLTVDAPVGTPVFVRLSDGTAAIATLPVSLASVPSHAVTNVGVFATQVTAATTGGYTPSKLISAAATNATVIKASAGTIGYLTASNINAAPRYLKIYNKATAPTVGTDVPVHTFIIPGNTAGAGTNIPLPPQGIALSAGISFAITTGVLDADVGAVAAAELVINYGTI